MKSIKGATPMRETKIENLKIWKKQYQQKFNPSETMIHSETLDQSNQKQISLLSMVMKISLGCVHLIASGAF